MSDVADPTMRCGFIFPSGWCQSRGFGVSARTLEESVADGGWRDVPVRRYLDADGRATHPAPRGADDAAWHVGRLEDVRFDPDLDAVVGEVAFLGTPAAQLVAADVTGRLAVGLDVPVSIVALLPLAEGGWAEGCGVEYLDLVEIAGIQGARLVPLSLVAASAAGDPMLSKILGAVGLAPSAPSVPPLGELPPPVDFRALVDADPELRDAAVAATKANAALRDVLARADQRDEAARAATSRAEQFGDAVLDGDEDAVRQATAARTEARVADDEATALRAAARSHGSARARAAAERYITVRDATTLRIAGEVERGTLAEIAAAHERLRVAKLAADARHLELRKAIDAARSALHQDPAVRVQGSPDAVLEQLRDLPLGTWLRDVEALVARVRRIVRIATDRAPHIRLAVSPTSGEIELRDHGNLPVGDPRHARILAECSASVPQVERPFVEARPGTREIHMTGAAR